MAQRTGKIVSITEAGDLVTDIETSSLSDAPRDDTLKIECDGHTTQGLYDADHGQPAMTFLAFENAAGRIQISIVGGNASGFLGITPGNEVVVRWQ